ncbi:MAG: cytochrome c, partial [Betaproteobacteria bacterium]|nr:cytochrome c [Betaproteobacteria bacterium]
AGQHADYLLVALTEYKNGSRKNAIMASQAAGLSKADMENLSAYYASLKGPLSNRR